MVLFAYLIGKTMNTIFYFEFDVLIEILEFLHLCFFGLNSLSQS